jgi:hypothetical protein
MDDASMMLEHLGFQEINLTNAITLDFKRKIKISLQKKSKQTINKKENKELSINFFHDSLSLSRMVSKTYEWEKSRI